jgi:tetratricopeptide (TPR) repeat protein
VALYIHGEVPSAARFLARAMSRPSTDLEFLRGTSTILRGLGLSAEAIAVQAYVVDRDPSCVQCSYLLASSYRDAGSFDKAEAMLQSIVDMSPADSPFGYALARTQLLNGKPQAALNYAEGVADDSHQSKSLALMARHSLGRVTEARAALDTLTKTAADVDPLSTAEALAWLGESSRAFDYLESMEIFHDFSGAWHSPFLTSLHDDPRWLALLEQRGVAPEQLEALDIRIQLPPGVQIVRN